MNKIVVGTDFSAHARRALEYGAAFGRLFGAELELVHVVTLSPALVAEGGAPVPANYLDQLRKEARHQLEALAAPLRAEGLVVQCLAPHGSASDSLRRAAVEAGADLIAVGTHGRTGLSRLMLGSTAERTARLAKCPVVGVHSDAPAPGGFHRITVATDFSPDATAALDWAIALARKTGGTLTLVHSTVPAWWLKQGTDLARELDREGERAARHQLDRTTAALATTDVDVQADLAHGPPDVGVLESAERTQADLIVTGCRGRSGLGHVLLGSQAERILRRAPVPVVVVKAN